jgi:hypothetical protein
MPHDPEAFADMVVMTVKAALAPVLERLAASEQANKDLQSRVLELSALRDRVTVVETKAAMPTPAPPVAAPVDLSPVLERLSAVEQAGKDVGGLRDRVTVLETKSTETAWPDLQPVVDRLTAAETALVGLGPVRDRLAAIETKAAPVMPPDHTDRIAALETRVVAAEMRIETKAAEAGPVLASVAELTKDMGVMRERVAVVEVRGQVPGPAGKDGVSGANGKDGKDGADGLGYDDLEAVQDDDRTFTIKAIRGDRSKTIGTLKFPVQIQQGVYVDGRSYTKGDVVTWGGSQWHCNEDTVTKPETSKAWTLIVKRGRDGKDGKDSTPPVVSLGR